MAVNFLLKILTVSGLKYEVVLRLRTIELIALWEGRLITNQISDWFGVSRQQASADINRYNSEINPNALIHDPAVKGYVPTSDFKPVLSSGHINEYMALLDSLNNQPMAQLLEGHSAISVQLPNRAVHPEVVRAAIKACRQQLQLSIFYGSTDKPKPTQRVIAPHTLVYTGFRWHIRAWCYNNQQFRDFLLSRIYYSPKLQQPSDKTIKHDALWQTQIQLRLIPNLLFNAEQRALIAHDYAMDDQQLTLSVRQALAQYTLQRYQAAITENEAQLFKKYPLQLHPEDRVKLKSIAFNNQAQESVDAVI